MDRATELAQQSYQWLLGWLSQSVLTVELAAEAAALVGSLLAAMALARPLRRLVEKTLASWQDQAHRGRAKRVLLSLVVPLAWLVLLQVSLSVATSYELRGELLRIASSLLTAWIGIAIASGFVGDPFWARVIAVAAWTIAALNILHLLEPTIAFLDGIAMTVGNTRLSLYLVLKGVTLAAILLSLAFAISRGFQTRVQRLPNLTPSVQVLLSQSLKFTLILLAVLLALGSIGIDLTALAVFGGAVGVGVGFGLQKVVSNLVSGIILLMDGSIKPGDVIELGQTYGWVNSLGARYASVVTRDGTEHLIPNEEFITQRVVNWSYSDSFVRRRVPIGVSYESDLDLASELILEAAGETERVLRDPAPQCLLIGFGDSSVDLELRFWIADPQNGTANVADRVLRKVWKKFHERGITIPFPQRDLHLRPPAVVDVRMRS